ncbi:T9SS type A sorting domain-containing protein [bacterium]|nr:T9SS type A sorting domain-containing protein [bacterium]
MRHFILTITLLAATLSQVFAQNYDLQFVPVKNDGVLNGSYQVKIQIKANTGSFNLGLSNLTFDYNTTGLFSGVSPDDGNNAPQIVIMHNFSTGNYSDLTLTEPQRGTLSLNINYAFETPNNGTSVSTSWVDVATIDFVIRSTGELSNLTWRDDQSTGVINPVIINDDALPANSIGRNSVSGNNVALPVELIYFSAAKQNQNVVLDWATAVEENCHEFEIQHSIDGVMWEEIGAVACSNMSISTRNYNYVDENVTFPVNYYRLKQVDNDGAYTYSAIEVVKMDEVEVADIELYPNPSHGFVVISSKNGFNNNSVKIYNSNGQLVFNDIVQSESRQIDLSGLPSGLYYVQMEDLGISKTFILQ